MKLSAVRSAVSSERAEPESLAQDRVMNVSQAVRREVQAMGEGIERTLAREEIKSEAENLRRQLRARDKEGLESAENRRGSGLAERLSETSETTRKSEGQNPASGFAEDTRYRCGTVAAVGRIRQGSLSGAPDDDSRAVGGRA